MKIYNKQTLRKYYVHFETKNISFLKMALLLDNMGVDNKFFFLALYDKGLRDVDPYDPDISDDIRLRIWNECRTNRWYFYREVFRIPESGSSTEAGGGVPFKLSRGNLAYLWAAELNISTYLIMPRQTGKTWAAIADNTWGYQFVVGYKLLHFNKSQGDANDNVRRIQEAIRMLPMYLQHSNVENLDPSDKRRVKNNEKSIRNVLNSTIEAMASAGNEAKADAMARGRTASKLWFDELAYIFFNEAIYGASIPAYEKAREIAEKNGVPYSVSITTTPGDLASPHGAYAYKMMTDSIRFEESMYDLKRDNLFDIIENTPDKTGILFIQFNHLQLGEDEEWYLKRFKKMNNPIKARREYLLEWINTNGNSPFDPDDIELIGSLARQKSGSAKVVKINKYFNLYVYAEYHGRKPVIISVDVSGALGRDSTAIVVINPETLVPMAFFKSNMIPSDHLRKLLTKLVTKHYPHCILTIENNSIGKPLLDELRDTSISRVLYKERKKRNVDQGVNSFTKKKTKDYVEYGHNVNSETRAQMMEMLESLVHNNHGYLAYPELYDEIQHLELKNGRIDHGNNTHDDCVMAYLGGLWIVRYGKGLKNKGIYYVIQERDEDDEFMYDTSESQAFAQRLLKRQKSDREEEDELLDYMLTEQPVYDSGTLAQRERAEYMREMDNRDDITDDDDELSKFIENIPDKTQRAILGNYYSMMTSNPLGDPFIDLLQPSYLPEDRNSESWATLYKY